MELKRSVTADEVNDIIEYLQGTTNNLSDAVSLITSDECELNDLTLEQHHEIDDKIFECVECGWWYEISDVSTLETDENYCNECKPE